MSSTRSSDLVPLLARLTSSRPLEAFLRGDLHALAHDAARHGVAAWLADSLAARGLTLGPAQAELQSHARGVFSNTARVRRLLWTAHEALTAAGVSTILLKGYGLGARLYPNPLGRPSADVDLLVPLGELPRSQAVLEGLGFTRFVDDSLGDVLHEHHHVPFTRGNALIEVHFKLMSGLGVSSSDDGVWARAVTAELDGRAVRFLAPEDEFVYLAAHAANHAFLRLSWLVDLQLFLGKHALDWRGMRRTADEWGCSAGVAAALACLEQSLEVSLPEEAREAFFTSRWRKAVDARVFSADRLTSAALPASTLSSFLVRLWLVDSPVHAARHLAGGAARAARRRLARSRR